MACYATYAYSVLNQWFGSVYSGAGSEPSVNKMAKQQVHNTRSVGKIELLAVDAAGIYYQFKSVMSLCDEDAVPRKNNSPPQIQTILCPKQSVR